MDELNALYFPEIVCLDERLLKYLLLIYDKVYFLPNDIRLNPGHESITKRFSINDSILSLAFGNIEEVHNLTMYSSEKKYWNEKMKKLMDMYDLLEDNRICLPIIDEDFEDVLGIHPLEDSVKSDINDNEFVNFCQKHLNRELKLPDPNNYGDVKGGGFVMPAIRRDVNPIIYFSFLCSERVNNTLYLSGGKKMKDKRGRIFTIDKCKTYNY